MGLPANVKALQMKIDPERRDGFARDYSRHRKSLLIALLLCLLGWHYFYLGKFRLQFIFLITLGGLFVWGLVDLFRLSGMVAHINDDIAEDLMYQYGVGREGMGNMGKLPSFLTT